MLTKSEINVVLKSIAAKQKSSNASICPRCGCRVVVCQPDASTLGALSRRADIYVCAECGIEEAMEDCYGMKKLPISEWALFRGGNDE